MALRYGHRRWLCPPGLLDAQLQSIGRTSELRKAQRRPHSSAMIERDDPVMRRLGPGEVVRGVVEGIEGRLVLTDRRVFITVDGRITLDVSIDKLRLVEFDLETERPATVIIVPEDPLDAPRQLAIEPQQYDEVASVLAQLGPRIEGSASQAS